MTENIFKCVNCSGQLQTRVVITHDPFNKEIFGEIMLKEDSEPLYKSELHFIEVSCHNCGAPKVNMGDLLLLTNVGDIIFRQNSTAGDFYKENNQLNKEELCQIKL